MESFTNNRQQSIISFLLISLVLFIIATLIAWPSLHAPNPNDFDKSVPKALYGLWFIISFFIFDSKVAHKIYIQNEILISKSLIGKISIPVQEISRISLTKTVGVGGSPIPKAVLQIEPTSNSKFVGMDIFPTSLEKNVLKSLLTALHKRNTKITFDAYCQAVISGDNVTRDTHINKITRQTFIWTLILIGLVVVVSLLFITGYL